MPDLILAGACVGLWLIAYAACRVATRPARPVTGPATMDLGPEPPAVVSMLVDDWSTSAATAESTLLDLAAAHRFELRQPDADPYRTTIHLAAGRPDRPDRPGEEGLRPYERQVLDRVRGLAVDGVVPLTALAFRDEKEAKTWHRALRAAVVADARAAGLSERRFGRTMMTALYVGAVAVGVVCGLVAVYRSHLTWTFLTVLPVSAVLAGLVQRIGERGTPAGLAAASRWLGVRSWLRSHEQFAELPPSAVAMWDRYLAYGAALGVTRRASDVIDLDIGNRRDLWSSYRGGWRRIRVRYPRGPWYGNTTAAQVVVAALILAAGALALVATGRTGWSSLPGHLLIVAGVCMLIRTVADLTRSVTVTGQVLARRTWRANDNHPHLDYLVVDDGTTDRTTAWGLPSAWGDRCRDRDVVTITARRWSRRIVAVTRHSRPADAPGGEWTNPPVTDVFGEVREPQTAGPLPVSVEDVARLVGQPVRAERQPRRVDFRSDVDNTIVLSAAWAGGTAGRIAWSANARGTTTALPGLGDGAYASGNRVVLRVGDSTLVVTALGSGRVGTSHLPWLLSRCDRAACV
ncbi:DUF2207 family protein [Micromonospora sp. DT233]|uniref:DUF2207 family protein n=1 Tax=Micromonospora sp. DT233 TaxID=3393432 RepID=UPI003CF8EC8C